MGAFWASFDAKASVDFIFKAVVAIWAVFLLIYLRQRDKANSAIAKDVADAEKARADAEKAKADVERQQAEQEIARTKLQIEVERERRQATSAELADKELELRIRRQVSVTIDIDVDEAAVRLDRPVIAGIRLTNNGNEATSVRWHGEPPAFTARHVSFDADGTAQFGPVKEFFVALTRDPTARALSHVVRVGSPELLAFAFQPDKAGLYLLAFRAAAADEVRKDAEKHGVRLPTAWTAKRYVYVPENTRAQSAAETERPVA